MIDLAPEQLETVKRILAAHAPQAEVRAFGSRVTRTAKNYSDLDLAIVGKRKLTLAEMSRLREAFEESDLPFRVDLLDWHAISPEFRRVIEQEYEVIQNPPQDPKGLERPLGSAPREEMSSNGRQTYKLRDLCTKIGSGATPRGGKESYLEEGPFALIRSQNVLDFFFSYDGLAFIDEDQANQLSNVEVQERDVLLNITGDSVARVCQVPSALLPARVNQHVSIIRPDDSKLNPEYLKYFFLNPRFKNYMLGLASVGATRNALTKGLIEDFEIDLPPLPTQRRIAAILSALDDKIELNRQTNATLEAIAQAIFKEWFVEKESTGEWDVVPLPEIISLNPPRQLKKGEIAPYLDMANMPTQGHRAVEWRDRPFGSGTKFMNGDTLLARITPCLENGKTAFVDFLEDGQTGWGSTEYIVFRPKPSLPPEYGYYLARTEGVRNHAIQNMIGTSGRQRASASCFDSFIVPVPPADLAANFGEIAGAIMAEIRANDEEARTLASIRDALLPKLMSGEIEV